MCWSTAARRQLGNWVPFQLPALTGGGRERDECDKRQVAETKPSQDQRDGGEDFGIFC